MYRIRFIAGLSNGETVVEGKGQFTETTGELSPWRKLLAYCSDRGLTITSLSLAAGDGCRWSLPSAGKNPKFKAFAEAEKPVRYAFHRALGMDVIGTTKTYDGFAYIEAFYQNGQRLQVWVSEQPPHASWSVIV